MCSDHSDVHTHSSFEAGVLPRLPPTAAASWSAASASVKVWLHRGELQAGDGVTNTMAKYLSDRVCTKVLSDGMAMREVVTMNCPDAQAGAAVRQHGDPSVAPVPRRTRRTRRSAPAPPHKLLRLWRQGHLRADRQWLQSHATAATRSDGGDSTWA